ncbi:transcription termination factor 3, mitochondrial [Sitophilus oryzae]|uniref:Transcription termination factor 3, mitochondrial n=1 Tax=Sitophilus oryzae TaxID=7048 RepID=A0A6J2Y0T2_SITOR|nr:transcription termination factor 3, mitochondrial [Sitophilus oryzae]
MLKQLLRFRETRVQFRRCFISHLTRATEESDECLQKSAEDPNNEISKANLLEPLSQDISHISTYLKPTFNVASYANKSEIIEQFVKLGVNLHLIEKKIPKAVTFILTLKFDDIKDHLYFLNELGLEKEDIGLLVTKNPFIFKENLNDLNVRITYLKFKHFTDDMIQRIVKKNPFWLSYSTQEIDEKLGFIQKEFTLSGNEVRQIAFIKPRLITYDQEKIKLNIFAVKQEMGFSQDDMKTLILNKPNIFTIGQNRLLEVFDYVHNTMNISLEQIIQNAEVFTCRAKRIKERHEFLVKLGRAQYDPKKPNYVALTTLIKDCDATFACEVAKSSIDTYNMYLKAI